MAYRVALRRIKEQEEKKKKNKKDPPALQRLVNILIGRGGGEEEGYEHETQLRGSGQSISSRLGRKKWFVF